MCESGDVKRVDVGYVISSKTDPFYMTSFIFEVKFRLRIRIVNRPPR